MQSYCTSQNETERLRKRDVAMLDRDTAGIIASSTSGFLPDTSVLRLIQGDSSSIAKSTVPPPATPIVTVFTVSVIAGRSWIGELCATAVDGP